MKILIFMAGFFPGKKYGGPPVSIDNFCNLMNDYEIYIICSDHDLGETKRYDTIDSGWNDRGNCKVLYLTDSEYSISNLNKIAKVIDPDLIYLQSLFSKPTYVGLNVAKMNKIKVLLAPRGELNTGAFKKKYKKIPYLYFLKIKKLLRGVYFQATSDDEIVSIIENLGISKKKIFKLENISKNNYISTNKIKNSGEARFIFISRIVPKKNLKSALTYFKSINGNVIFDIYGPIEDKSYWNICLNIIKDLPKNIIIKYKGVVEHDKIVSTFSKYDAFLFPTFSENYGHVIAEAILAGCIPIISDQTPWNDINDFKAGWAIDLNYDVGFQTAITEIVNCNDHDIKYMKKNLEIYAKNKMNLEKVKREYSTALRQMINTSLGS